MLSEIESGILKRIAQDDESAYESLFKAYFAELTVYAFRFLENYESSEEIVQDIFFNLWTNRKKINIDTSIKSYLYRSVKNTCLNIIKHQKVEEKYRNYYSRQIQQDELESHDWIVEDELSDHIGKAIEKMPPARKEVFILSKIENLKYKEIAEKKGISIKTVENHIGKALKFLRDELADFLPAILFFIQVGGNICLVVFIMKQ